MSNQMWDQQLERTNAEIIKAYNTILRPIEQRLQYDAFRPSWFGESIAQKKPFVTFMGPFSAGKSTFINYLLQGNFLHVGPQPTTDKFTVIMHGEEGNSNIPGRILAANSELPFRGLSQFGDAFLECFGGIQVNHPLLKLVSLVDTPGVLEAGDIHSRRYDYVKVCRWFVERSDLVFVMFDPTKLDAGQELRGMFKNAIKGCENKVRIILNKADSVGAQDLMRVYGSLYWNLSNLVATTEPPRVYVSSFWDKPYRPRTNHKLFTEEKSDLLYELTETVPLGSMDRRVSNMIKRTQDVMNHAIITGTLKQGLPKLFGKDKAKKEALDKLEETYQEIANRYKLSLPDFPDPEEYRKFFDKVDLTTMHRIETLDKEGTIAQLRKLIEQDLPALLNPIKSAEASDPRDRKAAIELQRQYTKKLQDQLEGQSGLQGPASQMAASPFVQGYSVPNLPTYVPQQMPPLSPVQVAPIQQPGGGGAMTPEQMMAFMQFQQQQQMAMMMAASQPQQQAPGSPALTQAQMLQMMQMMQQQKQ
eukprot:PhF_6_TR4878/c0_g1_i1/m.6867/K12483/EHD1; EH domain-containing protein 1